MWFRIPPKRVEQNYCTETNLDNTTACLEIDYCFYSISWSDWKKLRDGKTDRGARGRFHRDFPAIWPGIDNFINLDQALFKIVKNIDEAKHWGFSTHKRPISQQFRIFWGKMPNFTGLCSGHLTYKNSHAIRGKLISISFIWYSKSSF